MDYHQELIVLNNLADNDAFEEFRRCCGSRKWANAMLQHRPFVSVDNLFDTANTLWWTSSVQDWFEAFAAHPKIGKGESQ